MNQIIITVEGGVIQNIDGIPAGVEVVVIDFDTDGVSDSDTKENDDGDRYVESVYDADIAEIIDTDDGGAERADAQEAELNRRLGESCEN